MKPKLTKRELEILDLNVKENSSSGISGKLLIGLGTVEKHRRNLLGNMVVKNTASFVHVVNEHKLVN